MENVVKNARIYIGTIWGKMLKRNFLSFRDPPQITRKSDNITQKRSEQATVNLKVTMKIFLKMLLTPLTSSYCIFVKKITTLQCEMQRLKIQTIIETCQSGCNNN